MKKLTLLRHAKSDWHSAASTDFDRSLNSRGKKSAVIMGERLAASDTAPDLLISSPAKRARKTVQAIAKQLDYRESQIDYREEIYEASLKTLILLLHNLDDTLEQLIMVGHNPGFSELGQWLNSDAPDWLPTCGLLALELQIDSWSEATGNCAEILCYDYPKRTD